MNAGRSIPFLDWILAVIYIVLILIYVINIQKSKIRTFHFYEYFLAGICAKMVGAIFFCIIYIYYYKGGDTLGYHDDSCAMINLLLKSPLDFLQVLFNIGTNAEQNSLFDSNTGFPYFLYASDKSAMNATRLICLVEIIGIKSYLLSSIVMSLVSFSGIWKLYTVFCSCYPHLYKYFAVTVLFVPSVLFWGSGLLKDSLTLSAAGWYCYSFYQIFIAKKSPYFFFVTLIIAVFVMVLIKPYIFVGLLPGSLIWGVWDRLLGIKNIFFRFLMAPLIVIGGLSVGMFLWSVTSSNLGEYGSVDDIVRKAYVTYDDLKRDHYKGNSFDIGEYDQSLAGILSKFPIATTTGLFRPFIWEAKNTVMVLSAIENLIVLCFTLFFLLRRPLSFVSSLFTNPLVLFCMIFGLFFAFSVGVSTSNFGAMVRLRIPAIPFFLSGLVLVEYLSRDMLNRKRMRLPR